MASGRMIQSRRVVRLVVALLVSSSSSWFTAPQPGLSISPLFIDVSTTYLIGQPPEPKFSMGASAADLDGDGDLDLAIAAEYAPNRILVNDGTGRLSDESDLRLPRTSGDHEDVAVADFDIDGDLDLVFVGEDDQVNGYHLNDGDAVFADVTERLPRRGTSNAVVAVDVDRDGDADLVVGNNGQDFLFVNRGDGTFDDRTNERLPPSDDVTQDIEPGDIDGDTDIDLVLGNEDGNRVLVNDGSGTFLDETADRFPAANGGEETRDADLVDVDGDGDLDLYLANVLLFADDPDPQDRLLINDGTGRFGDETSGRLPAEQDTTMSAAFVDIDLDGDPDVLTGSMGDLSGQTADAPYRAFINDGQGVFAAWTTALPTGVTGNGFDVEPADIDGDGRLDLFLASRGGTDRVLLAVRPED